MKKENKYENLLTQRTALNALIFLYREFLEKDLGKLSFNLSTKHRRIPVVFSTQEASQVIKQMQGITKLIIILMYGSGLRTAEVCSLRIKDIDFPLHVSVKIHVRELNDVTIFIIQFYTSRLTKLFVKLAYHSKTHGTFRYFYHRNIFACNQTRGIGRKKPR